MELEAIDDVNVGQYTNKKKKSGGFQSMNLIYPVYRAVQAKGFNVPTPIQRKVIPLVLEGRDVVAASKTGSGKTAAYMIPLINRLKQHSTTVGTRALIILPTRELTLQTASVFKQFSKFTDLLHTVIVGGHGFEGQYESLASNPDLIIATPGRLMQHLTETSLSLAKVEMIVIDEADYLFEKGYEEQLRIILGKLPQQKQVVLLSATIPEQLTEFARVGLKDYVFAKLDSEYTIPDNMSLQFFLTRSQDKLAALLYFLQEHVVPKNEKTVVFAATRYHVDVLVDLLRALKIDSVGIYGKMDQLSRKEQLFKFKSNQCNLLIVTDLAARGIDIPHINHVINWDFPSTSKMFIHRVGRTARAGRSGTAYTFLSMNEIVYLTEVQLYLGRTLDVTGSVDDTSKALYGILPEAAYSEYTTILKETLDKHPDIEKEMDVCTKAFKLFTKTRVSASKSAIRKSKRLDRSAIHPMFKSFENDQDVQEFYDKIKNYRPKVGYLEFKKQSGDLILDQGAERFLKNAKKIVARRKELKTIRGKTRNYANPDANSDEEDFEDSDIETDEDDDHKKEDDDLPAPKSTGKGKTTRTETDEDGLFNIETEEQLENPQKKVKRSRLGNDFKHPTQYISNQPSSNNPFIDLNKIGQDDTMPFVVADEAQELGRHNRKSYTWDKLKKKYVITTEGNKGKIGKRDKQDKNMGEDVGKKTFQKWSKKNMMKYQRVGEQEDQNATQKARELFAYRKKRLSPEAAAAAENGGAEQGGYKEQGRSNKGMSKNSKKIRKPTNELKRPEQILKAKKTQYKAGIKNMPKKQRATALNKQKSFGKKKGGK